MLDRAAAETDTTLGRYIEKALRAQFRKDGIVSANQLEQLLQYMALIEDKLAKGHQIEISVIIDGEVYVLRRRDMIREQDKKIKSARSPGGFLDYKLVRIGRPVKSADISRKSGNCDISIRTESGTEVLDAKNA